MRFRAVARTILLAGVALALPLGCGSERPAKEKAAEEPPKAKASKVAMFGGGIGRNLVNLVEKNVLDNWSVKKGSEKNVKWSARLGTKAYGGPTIAGGRIFVGTNNERPRNPAIKGDRGVLMCFRESDGEFLWQITHAKLPDGEVNDFPREGVASAPAVDDQNVYYVNNRCEIVCADVKGDPAKKGRGKILWKYDMIKELSVFPCQLANCSPLIAGDNVYVVTGHGVDIGNGKVPDPKAPSFIAVNKKTGMLVWKSNLPGSKILRGQWGNPAAAMVNGKLQVIFPGGDGWVYGLDGKDGKLIWKFDCNPKKATAYRPGGGGERCFIIATPVIWDNKAYIAVGQEPDDGPGVGHLWCIDITKKPANKEKDLSPVDDNFNPKAAVNKSSGLVWHYGGPVIPKPKKAEEREIVFGRTLSTVAIHDGLLYATELAGYMHVLDAKTGKKCAEHDFEESTWCSPYYVDGKVFVGTDSGDLNIFRAGKKPTFIRKISMGTTPLKVPVVVTKGVLYVNTGSFLYAISPAKK
jgi:outer membrane protein assembly factor BamB